MKSIFKILGVASICLVPTHALADWSGIYAGVSGGTTIHNELRSNDGDLPDLDIDDGLLRGVFIGTQVQRGDVVYGGEFAFLTASDAQSSGQDDLDIDIYDVKGRLGYAFDKTLAYATIGLSNLDAEQDNDDYEGLGANFGLGVDYLVGEHFVVGAEFLFRRAEDGEDDSIDFDANSLSFRAALKF
ncbi:porin family protein [Yoonia sp. GPGPB17]|uniref:outer membrane protein n=1 Tax=Yoonia sp. GPGPB17 TaxID=3026147 RepID=UPI0030BBB3CB